MTGVYVPNIDKPESCKWCDLIGKDGWCPVVNTYASEDSYKTCPVVTVSDHGRLVDVDAILKEVNLECDKYDACITSTLTCLNRILSIINNAPVVIPADKKEVK